MSPGLRAPAAVRGRRIGALVVLGVCLGVAAGCQPSGPSPVATVPAIAASSEPATPAPAPTPPADAASPSGDAVAVDPSLLEILPPDVGGVPIEPAPEAATQMALDLSLAADVEALAVALAVSEETSSGENLVIANVVRLRRDVFDETFFEGWRSSYDRSACEPAGGLLGTGEDEIDGRQVFVGSCANGALTYHVRYGEDVIVSLTSTGEGRFGEIVMAHLGA